MAICVTDFIFIYLFILFFFCYFSSLTKGDVDSARRKSIESSRHTYTYTHVLHMMCVSMHVLSVTDIYICKHCVFVSVGV